MALKRSAVQVGGGVFAIVAACANGEVTPPAAMPVPPAGAKERATVVGAPSLEPCKLGEVSGAVPRMEIETLLSNPEPYYGRQLVLRGYFILEGVEATALVEPKHRQAHILVGVKRLPAKTAEQLLACRLKLVDVQGYISHVPSRGGEALIIFGEAIVGSAK